MLRTPVTYPCYVSLLRIPVTYPDTYPVICDYTCKEHRQLATMRVVKDIMKESYGRPYFVAQSTGKMNLSHEWANSVYVDEVSQSECQKLCRLHEAIFAQAVGREVYNLGKERYDHPSQRRHECLMLTHEEKWEMFGSEAIERVNSKRAVWSEFVEAAKFYKTGRRDPFVGRILTRPVRPWTHGLCCGTHFNASRRPAGVFNGENCCHQSGHRACASLRTR